MRIKPIAAVVFEGIILFGFVFAQETQNPPQTPQITKKQKTQQMRIKQGVKSGELTNKEAARLKKDQAKIQKHKKAANADGMVTPKDRQKIHKEKKRAGRDINRLKHNKTIRK